MKKLHKGCIWLAALILTLMILLPALAQQEKTVTILFTHDLHSHFLPSADEDGGEFGGYARLMHAISTQKALDPDALLVDGGDFSMGSLFQTAYADSALELRMMGRMGYDATTFGNHEYDYLPKGLSSMLQAALASGDPLPAIVEANYLPPDTSDADILSLKEALDAYGVKPYEIVEKGGVPFVLFGLMGIDGDDCAPGSGMILHDPEDTAKEVIRDAGAQCRERYGMEPIYVCLSHSGTSGGEGEDYDLAKAVPEIDIIISGHTHTTLYEPILVGNTVIASAGEYGRNLGIVRLSYDGQDAAFSSYELIPIDENCPEDPEMALAVSEFKEAVNTGYLADYGYTFDQVVVHNPYSFDSVDEVYATQHESTLGNLFSDAYRDAASRATGISVDVAVTASGVVRETIPLGDVSVSAVFNTSSLGVGTEGELILLYLTGADLKTVLEIDASVQPLMRSAQLFSSGVKYSFNTNRMLFNKVDSACLIRSDGKEEAIVDDQLYSVVTGRYVGQMLGSVEEMSYGLIKITPRDADGNPVNPADFGDYVIQTPEGKPLKEWYAITDYLHRMGGQMDPAYSQPDGRKQVYSSLNPIALLKNANVFTWILCAVILLVILLIALAARGLVRWILRVRKK